MNETITQLSSVKLSRSRNILIVKYMSRSVVLGGPGELTRLLNYSPLSEVLIVQPAPNFDQGGLGTLFHPIFSLPPS